MSQFSIDLPFKTLNRRQFIQLTLAGISIAGGGIAVRRVISNLTSSVKIPQISQVNFILISECSREFLK